MKHKERILLIALCMLSTTTIFALESSAHFYAKKTSTTPTGAGLIYVTRGGADDILATTGIGWESADNQFDAGVITVDENNPPDGYKVYNGKKDNKTIGVLNMHFYAKPNKGYQFNGWYDKENGGTKLEGSTALYPHENLTESTSEIQPSTWTNGEDGAAYDATGYFEDGGYYYLRHVQAIKNGENKDITYYADFSLTPRPFTLVATGVNNISYTTTSDKIYSVGDADNITTEPTSSNIELTLNGFDENQHIFTGWYWSSGLSGTKTQFSTDLNATYELNKTNEAAARDNVFIWAMVSEKVDHVAEVTYNDVTTPYEKWDEALAAAKADGVSGAIIKLKMDIPDVLTTVQTIDRPMTIDLNNHSINGSVNNLFTISSPNVVITDNSVAKGGAITLTSADTRVTYTVTITSGGQLTLENGSIINKNTYTGADKGTARGLEVQAGASLKMTGGYVEAQSAQMAYAIINRGTTTISGGEAYANTTTAETAVGFYNVGSSATINGGVFRALTKTTGAYGIWQNIGNTLTINNAIVSATATTNTAYALRRDAGKIIVNDGKFKVSATSTLAPVNTNNNTYITLYGGVYNKYTNLRKSAASGYDCYELELGQDYTDGYRFCIKDKNSNPSVCKIVELKGTSYYSSLADALAYANANSSAMTIILTAFEHTLPAGNYTLPKNATLLVPFDVEGTISTNTPIYVEDGNTAPTPFRILTLAENTNIIVHGSICVNSRLRDYQNMNGAQHGACGMMNMMTGSTITLNSGANLYCWGIIYGEGEITANSGATVYESFQVNDYPGGTFLSTKVNKLKDYHIFPIRMYCFPNIQNKLHLKYGATDIVATAFASLGLQKDIVFISKDKGLFTPTDENSYITKWYDINEDVQRYELRGNANFKSVQFTVGRDGLEQTINSADFILPITHNMHINLLPYDGNKPSKVTLTENMAIHPSAYIQVSKNVTVNINPDKALFIYDTIQWQEKYTYAAIATNAASNKNNFSIIYGRTAANKRSFFKKDLSDAVLEVAGTIEVNGALYTTESGADIRGIDGGKIIFKAAAPTTSIPTVYQVIQDPEDYPTIPITPAQLHNDEEMNQTEPYTQTSGALAGDEFWYVESLGKWVKNEFGPELDIVDANGTNLTINANGWASSGWPYTINGTTYTKDAREDDRTLIIPYNGTTGASLPIAVLDEDGKPICRHIYKVPFVYTGTENMNAMNENSIVFVKSGTLTVDGAKAKEIYVAPGAALQVNGTLTVGKLVLRTTPFDAAILTNKGTIAGQVYYSRIARDTDFHLFAIPAGSNTANVVLSDGTSAAVASTVAPYGNAWQLREYNTARRAELGADGANWDNIGWDNIVVNGDTRDTTYSDVAIEASKGYELRSGSKYYREYLFPVTLPTTATSVQVTDTTSEAGAAAGAAHAGWNILCSPYTYIYTAEYNDPARGIKVSWQYQELDGSYSYIQEQPTQIKPAVPFAYQTKENGSLNFSADSLFLAPRKQSAAEALTETEWIHLDIFDAYGEGDETSLFVHPTRFEQTYKTGIDVAKQSLTAPRPIIYSTHAYGDMAFAGVADSLLENGIDLVVYSPAEQKLTFSLRENKFLHRLEYLWLADNETGERTDLLMDDYTCRANAGTTKGRFVLNGRFKAPQISTGISNTQTDYNIYAIGNNIAISGVEQGTPIYVFDAVGHMIYTTAATSDEVIVPAPCAGVYMLTIGGQTAKLVVNQ